MGAIRRIEIVMDEDIAAEAEDAVAAGEFATLDDVVRSAFEAWYERRLEAPENVERLRRLWEEGLASGPAVEMTGDWFEDIKRRGRERAGAARDAR